MPYSDDSIGGHGTIKQNAVPAVSVLPDKLVGAVLNDRYQIERKLGQGGFGTVYLATDNKVVSRKIVVKVLHTENLTNDWTKKKFQQELEALGRIDHPSVVGVLDSGDTEDGRPYIVMQYIDGVSLRSLLTSEGMNFKRAAKIIKQVGKALTAAHQAGILHRDLKPENIMIQTLEDDEYVKVIDFGVAKVRNSVVDVVTSKDVAVGTIAYMSPEQLSAQPVVQQSDIYAMGVIAYEMLTGKRPTNPESAFQLLELQRSGVRVKPSDLRPGLPADAEKVILRALSFEPQNRYERARDFGDLLSSALVGDKDQTQLATLKVPLKVQGVKTQPSRRIIAAVAMIIVLTTGFILWRRGSRQPAVSSNIPNTGAPAPAAPERSFTYWLTYQKMRAGKPDSELRQSAGNDIFGNGWRFQFNFTPNESGALYLLNVGPGKDQKQEYNILFPLLGVGKVAPDLQANQTFQSGRFYFVDKTGVERFWVIWSAKPISELDSIFSHAASNHGVIGSVDEIAKIQNYLSAATSEVIHDKEKKQTVVKGHGDIVVSLVELTHEAN